MKSFWGGILLSAFAAVAAATQEPAAPLRVSVLVQDGEGKPVRGARIVMEPRRSVYDEALAELAAASPASATQQPSASQLTMISDDGGRGELVAPSAGMYRVHVVTDGKAPVELDLTPLVEATVATPATLTAGTPLTVTVRDPAGQPLAGAWVELEPGAEDSYAPWDERTSWRLSRQRALTGPDGTARFQAAARTVAIKAWKVGFVAARWSGSGQPLRHEMRLTAGELRPLVVRDTSGRLVVDAVARLPRKGTIDRSALWLLGRTGERGRLRVALAAGETAEISVLGPRGEHARVVSTPARAGAGQSADDRATEQPAREVRLRAPLVLSGRVLEAVSRLPLAGAVVWAAGEEANGVKTDQSGGFTLTTSSTQLELHAAAANHRRTSLGITAAGERFATQPTLLLDPAVVLRGRVVDARQRAISGATVRVNAGRPTQARRRTTTSQTLRTDSAGKFVAIGLPAGADLHVFASAAGYAGASVATATPTAAAVQAAAAPAELELVLTRGESVVGRIVDPQSRPVAGATVTLMPMTTPNSFESLGSQPRVRSLREGRSGVEGKFALDGLAGGSYRLTASATGFARLERPGIEVPESVEAATPPHGDSADASADSTSGAALDLGDLELALGATLHGEVVDPNGAAIPGAVIVAQPTSGIGVGPGRLFFGRQHDSSASQASSDAQGRFTLVDLSPDTTYELAAHHEDYASAFRPSVSIDPAKPPLRIVLQHALTITGSVVDERGIGLPGASVAMLERGDATGFNYHRQVGAAVSDDQGGFAVRGVPPVKIEVDADLAGWVSASPQTLDLAGGGEIKDVVIVMRPGGTIHGRVTDSAGSPIAGVYLEPVRETVPGWIWGEATTDGDGTYALGPMPPGRLTIAATADGFVMARRDLAVAAGDNRLDVTLERGHLLTGVVVDPDGAPVPGASVSLAGSQQRPSGSGRTGQDGRFSLAGVAPGQARLSARASGYASATREINVGREPTTDLVLQLAVGSTLTGWIRGLPESSLPEVQILAFGRDGMVGGKVAADGSYRVEQLAAGLWHIHARLAKREVRERLEIVAGSPATLDLTFGKGLQLSAVVTLAGAPFAEAMIDLRGLDVSGYGNTTCDQDGRFTLSELPAGTYRLEVAGFAQGIRHFETIELASDLELTIDVVTGRLAGRLIDAATGEPVAGGTVSAHPAVDETPRAPSQPVSAMSDTSGFFTLGELSPGRWRLEAAASGYQLGKHEVELAPGNREETVLQLSSGAMLGLHVTTASGAPLREVWVGAVDAQGQSSGFTLPVGEAGRVETTRLAPGPWTLYLSSTGTSVAGVSVNVPGENGQVVLPLAAHLVVRVPALADEVRWAEIALVDATGRPFWAPGWQRLDTTFPLARGRAELRNVSAGTWQVTVTAADGRRWSGNVTITLEGPNELVLD